MNTTLMLMVVGVDAAPTSGLVVTTVMMRMTPATTTTTTMRTPDGVNQSTAPFRCLQAPSHQSCSTWGASKPSAST
jgi:hypothetical protein